MPGGWESTWARLLGELVRRGRKVTVLTPRQQVDWPIETVHNGVRVLRLAAPGRSRWSQFRYLARLVNSLRKLRAEFDSALVAGLGGDAYATLGEAQRSDFPVLLQPERPGIDGDCYRQVEASCGPRLKKRCYRADAYLAATPLLERELIAAGYARSRIHGVPLGIDQPPMPTPAERMEARRNIAHADPALAAVANRKLVVCVGRLRMSKGLDVLLDAWRRVVESHADAELWLVGDGPDAAALRERIFEFGLYDRVRLTGAFDDLEDVWRAADAAVCPSPVDGIGVALREAAAHGLPVVASDAATHAELFSAEREVALFPRGEAPALAESLLRVLSDTPWAAQLGVAARRRAAHDYSPTSAANAYEAILDRVLAASAEARR
jgi:glycosyltransferase involved in cell wall biosynthesis